MDAMLCFEHTMRKAQKYRENVSAVFFDIEKACDMLWKEGTVIKHCKLITKCKMFIILSSRKMKDFLEDRKIKVRKGNKNYQNVTIENGTPHHNTALLCAIENSTPQGSIVSPLLFSVMINNVFAGMELEMEFLHMMEHSLRGGRIWSLL